MTRDEKMKLIDDAAERVKNLTKKLVDEVDKLDSDKFGELLDKAKAKSADYAEVIKGCSDHIISCVMAKFVDKMSRKECVKYIKLRGYEPPFDVEEASGDELREYIRSMASKRGDENTWIEKIKSFYDFEKNEEPYLREDDNDKEMRIDIDDEEDDDFGDGEDYFWDDDDDEDDDEDDSFEDKEGLDETRRKVGKLINSGALG